LAREASGHSPIPYHSLIWPVKGTIIEKFGRQKHPELGTPYISNGILMKVRNKAPIHLVADGHVLFAGAFMRNGLMVLVEHPGDWYTVYGRMSRIDVEKGQEVKNGFVLGLAGIDEKGKGEVYFEIRFYKNPTDPLPWLVN